MVCHSAAERSHSTSEVRGRSREDPMPEGQQPRGVTPSPRSGATAESTRLPRCRNARGATPRQRSGRGGAAERRDPASEVRGSGQEKLPHAPNARGQGWRMGGATHAQDQGRRGEELPASEVRGDGREDLPHAPKPEAKGSGREEQLHVQGAVAAWAQEGLEELSHVEGQEGRR